MDLNPGVLEAVMHLSAGLGAKFHQDGSGAVPSEMLGEPFLLSQSSVYLSFP